MSAGGQCDRAGDPPGTGAGVVGEPLLLLADVALAPPGGDSPTCSCDLEVRRMEETLLSLQLHLQLLLRKADELQGCLANELGYLERETLAVSVLSFLYTCQPYFNYLESTAHSAASHLCPLPFDYHTRLLDLSQQLSDRMEQLVLTFAGNSLLCLDETEPNSVSHFCIGQTQLGCLRLTAFLYCRPTPYLAHLDTGLHKRMRWNVDRLESEEREAETVGTTEYYFLCCEDIPNAKADGKSQDVSHRSVVRMWSIGQWVQMNPDPNTEDIYDWILCEVPQASYHRLLLLGSSEPLSRSATDILQQLLLSQQSTGTHQALQEGVHVC